MWSSWGCSAVAGLLGALAACSAKLALGADYLRDLCAAYTGQRTELCDWIHLLLRLCCIGLVFVCNAAMWTFFAKALRFSSSSAAATVTTTASNFISSSSQKDEESSLDEWRRRYVMWPTGTQNKALSPGMQKAFLGTVLFGESRAILWWVGISITLCGLVLLHTFSPQAEESTKKKS